VWHQVWDGVKEILETCGDYFIHYIELNPKSLGAPVSRKRVYILMIRRDALTVPESTARADIAKIVSSLKEPSQVTWSSLLFPEKHKLVKAARRKMQKQKDIPSA